MNFTENFEQFSSRLTNTDLALYAGLGLIIWVFVKDKLNPAYKIMLQLLDKIQSPHKNIMTKSVVSSLGGSTVGSNQNTFFDLIVSWKQTRDLAVQNGCDEAVKVADQMFPLLGPNVCSQTSKQEVSQ